MRIRKIEEKDLEDLREVYIELCDEILSLEGMTASFKRIINNEAYYLLGAEIDGKIVGTLMGIVCFDVASNNQNFMTVENVVVLEAYRGRGICTALFEKIEQIAKENKCAYLYFVSGKQRSVAHALYAKLGYADEGAKGFRKHFKNETVG